MCLDIVENWRAGKYMCYLSGGLPPGGKVVLEGGMDWNVCE